MILLLALLIQDGDLTDVDREALKLMKDSRAAGSLVLHYSADQLKPAQVDKAAEVNSASFAKLHKLLKMEYKGTVHIFLYPNVEELKRVTRQDAPAFSTGTRSIHQAHDFANVHELCHIFALQFPRGPASVEPELFFVEGLATALDRTDAGLEIDTWVAVYDRLGWIPDLVAYRRGWPKDTPQNVHPYYIPASFMGFLVGRFGIEKVKTFYMECLEAHKVFGRTFAELEADWRDAIMKRALSLEDEAFARKALGLPAPASIPKTLAEAKGRRLFDGRSLDGWKPANATAWTVSKSLLVGTNDGPWTHLEAPAIEKGPVAVRARFRLAKGNAVKLMLNRTGDSSNDMILTTWGSYLTRGGGSDVVTMSRYRLSPGRWYDVVFESKSGRGRLYLNGRLEMETYKFSTDDGTIGIAVERGTVEIESIESFIPGD